MSKQRLKEVVSGNGGLCVCPFRNGMCQFGDAYSKKRDPLCRGGCAIFEENKASSEGVRPKKK